MRNECGLWSVPRDWPGATVVCLATGPSLTSRDVGAVWNWWAGSGDHRVIAVNNAYAMAPWADVLYACDNGWWRAYPDARRFLGIKVGGPNVGLPMVHQLEHGTPMGLSDDPTRLNTGSNSGYQAVNLAVLFGAARVLLVGYDCRAVDGKMHYFGSHAHTPTEPPFWLFLEKWPTLVEPLKDAGVEVVNCTPGSAIDCFPRQSLEEALCH